MNVIWKSAIVLNFGYSPANRDIIRASTESKRNHNTCKRPIESTVHFCENNRNFLHLKSVKMRFTFGIFGIMGLVVLHLMAVQAEPPFYESISTTASSSTGSSCVCNRIYSPLCASDGKTYSNDCELDCAQKKNPSLCITSYKACASTGSSSPGHWDSD